MVGILVAFTGCLVLFALFFLSTFLEDGAIRGLILIVVFLVGILLIGWGIGTAIQDSATEYALGRISKEYNVPKVEIRLSDIHCDDIGRSPICLKWKALFYFGDKKGEVTFTLGSAQPKLLNE